MSTHIEVHLQVDDSEYIALLVAELSALGYDSFWELPDGLKAYIEHHHYQADDLQTLLQRYAPQVAVALLSAEPLEEKNWNEEWEKNFEHIAIEDKILIKAVFHDISGENFHHQLLISPKMAFGTGHHATTYLMLRAMYDMDFAGKKVLDFGCGTGILAVFAAMKGATAVLAIDNDEWATENTAETMALNGISQQQIQVELGEKSSFVADTFDTILANINLHVLLDAMQELRNALRAGGTLLLSGILSTDEAAITAAAQAVGLEHLRTAERNNWLCMAFEHKT
ncbi:MAG: 50S ribosomal protein L11 methyltransferase [Sphingobacteriales bacterium]|nr:50S ribosomal protein L11 methyltransferase [Sphingobacteriales bacterium]